MPHSTFKYRPIGLASGTMRCPCGQTFEHKSDRDWNMKIRMNKKFCNRVTDPKVVRQPRKAMTVKEAQCAISKSKEFH